MLVSHTFPLPPKQQQNSQCSPSYQLLDLSVNKLVMGIFKKLEIIFTNYFYPPTKPSSFEIPRMHNTFQPLQIVNPIYQHFLIFVLKQIWHACIILNSSSITLSPLSLQNQSFRKLKEKHWLKKPKASWTTHTFRPMEKTENMWLTTLCYIPKLLF